MALDAPVPCDTFAGTFVSAARMMVRDTTYQIFGQA